MKKSKIILAVILAMVMLFALTAVAACKENHVCGHVCPTCNKCKDDSCTDPVCKDKCTCTPEPEGTWTLQNITLGGTYKTEYQLNEAFSASGLTVSAAMQNVDTSAKRTDDVTANAQVDSSKFNSAMVGNYVISVSYTYNGVTRYAHYSVAVKGSEPQINGISMTKTTVDYDVPQGASTVNVNLDDITVNAVNGQGEVETTPLEASEYTLTFYRGGQQVDNLQNAEKGAYTIQAERKSDHQKAFIVVYVLDPATKIEFKTGTVTQSQALTNEMSSTWTFTVTDRSGTTHELVADDVELSAMNTLVAGSYTATATYSEYDAKGQPAAEGGLHVTVDYTITKNDALVNQSYAVNISNVTTSKLEIKEANQATDGVLSAEGGISLIAGSRTITIETDPNKTCGTKSFSWRMKFGGKSENNARQIKIDLKGASLITVYAKSGSSSSARGIGLYSDATVAASSRLDSTEPMLGTIVPLTYLVEKAGTYYLAAPDGDVNIYYIQVDTVLTGEAAEGQQSVELPTATEVSGITLNTEAVKKDFVKGDTFTYDGLVVSKTIYNPVTAEASSEIVTEGYSVSTPDMSVQGKPTVTVTYNGKTATYSINVNSLVDGVNGIKVGTEKSTVELDNEGDTVEIKQADFTVTTDSGAAIVTGTEAGQCSNIKFELFAENGTEPLSSWIVGAGTYRIKVTATYNNSTIAGTTDFTAECTVTVKVKKVIESGTKTYNLDLTAFSALADQAALTQENLTGNNAFLTKSTGTLVYRTSGSIEIKNDGLTVTFEGTGIIKITAMSNGGTNKSALFLRDKNGNYITATFTADAAIAEVAQDKGNVYTIVGTTAREFTFTITEAGTYTIGTMNVNSETGRNTRIKAIEMTDTVGGGQSSTTTNTLDLSAFSALANSTALTQEHLTDKNAFLTKVDNTNTKLIYRTNANGCIEIQNDALTVTFEGTGTIKISVQSNGDANKSAIYLKDKDGNYITAAFTANESIGEVAQDKGNVYTVLGQTAYEFTFTVTEAGTYTIGTMNVNGETGRVTRVKAIEMIDTVNA